MRTAIALGLAASISGCVDVAAAPDFCIPFAPTYLDLASAPPPMPDMVAVAPPADLAAPDLSPPGPRTRWLTPPDWAPASGGWTVNGDGNWSGIGTLRARLPAGPPPTALLVDYAVAAGSTARVWLRSWSPGPNLDATPDAVSVLVAIKTTSFATSYLVSSVAYGSDAAAVLDIVDDGVGGYGALRGVRVTTP